ncbi:MAG: hypothetical protein K2N12_07440, partial [Helicobacter sp.]|nr:hypothetical protein [Helicobacter sp.]
MLRCALNGKIPDSLILLLLIMQSSQPQRNVSIHAKGNYGDAALWSIGTYKRSAHCKSVQGFGGVRG